MFSCSRLKLTKQFRYNACSSIIDISREGIKYSVSLDLPVLTSPVAPSQGEVANKAVQPPETAASTPNEDDDSGDALPVSNTHMASICMPEHSHKTFATC